MTSFLGRVADGLMLLKGIEGELAMNLHSDLREKNHGRIMNLADALIREGSVLTPSRWFHSFSFLFSVNLSLILRNASHDIKRKQNHQT